MNKLKTFLKQYLSLILIMGAIGAYVVFAGKAGTCPTCVAVTDFIGLSGQDEAPVMDSGLGWSVTDLNGQAIHSTDLEGKVVIVDFWATWCPPCRKEIPGFIELQEEYGSDGLVILGVSLDETGQETVRDFVLEQGINYPIAMGNRELVDQFGGVRALPTTFVIDRQGKIVNRHVGYASKATFEADIKELL